MDSKGEIAFQGALFHSREHLRIRLSSAATGVEIDGNRKGLSDTGKYKKCVVVKKKKSYNRL